MSKAKFTEVEYWVEPVPGLGGRVPPFKAADKESGLRFVVLNRPLYQLKPRYQFEEEVEPCKDCGHPVAVRPLEEPLCDACEGAE